MDSYNKQNPETIQHLFNDIAKNYDRGNAVLSCQLFRFWNQTLIKKGLVPFQPAKVLDLCCGTGEIGLTYLSKHCPKTAPKELIFLDFSKQMLACAKEKAKLLTLPPTQLKFIEADAQKIPLRDKSVSAVTVAYGIRNIKDPYKCIQEVHRVLLPGGHFSILELTRPSNPLLRFGHEIYLNTLVPVVGRLLTSNKQAYQYLKESIQHFIPPEELQKMMHQAGFREIKKIKLAGGIATLLIATR